jgi:glycosyltransferase involved in cell wall biosynthesis
MQSRVAYILKAYGRTSETFITNEIDLLGQLGLDLRIFSLKSLSGEKRHAALERIQAPVTWLPEAEELSGVKLRAWLRRNAPKFWPDHRALIQRNLFRYIGAFTEALGYSARFRRKVFLREFLQAGTIARHLLDDPSVQHIHAHFCHGSTTVAMLASRLSGIPFSFTAHAKDIYVEDLNPGDLLQRKIARAEFVVTCTGANKTHLDARLPNGAAPVRTIYHGLDTELFRPRLPVTKPVVPRILSVGRFVEKKGFLTLVDACALLRERGLRFTCLLVGGADAHQTAVEQRIRHHGLTGIIEIRNAVTQQQLRNIYDDSSVFALPCQVLDNGDRDGIPNVLAEAMAMRLPVVSTNISGIPELVESGKNGLLVPPRNADALAEALGALIQDPSLGGKLGDEARATILRVFDSRENTRELAKLFWARIGREPAVEAPERSVAAC